MTREPSDSDRGPAPRRRRGWLAACLALTLLAGACVAASPRLDSADPVTTPAAIHQPEAPRFVGDIFVAGDGARLPLRRWLPKGPPRAVILALHGYGDYSHAFEAPARLWAARGIATYAYDQRGFGRAPGRGSWPGEGQLAVDAVTASRILRLLYPGRRIYLLGESMGGAVATLAATGAIHGVLPSAGGAPVADVDGVVLSAPAVWGRQIMDLLPKIALWAGVRFLPGTVLTGQGLKIQASDNIPMLQALGRDPLVIKGSRIDTIYGLVNLMDSTIEAAPRFTAPLLLMYGKHDQIIPSPAIESFVAALPAEPDTRRKLAYYEHGYHLLLRDLEGPVVAEDIASWIFDHARPLPSHADALQDDRPWPPHGEEEGGGHG